MTRNLLIMPFGNGSLHSDWIFSRTNRQFDVKLLFYHKQIEHPVLLQETEAFGLFHLQDTKWWMAHTYLTEEEPNVIEKYDNFFFPDDDLLMSMAEINRLFTLFSKVKVMMAQPSLTTDSYRSFEDLVNRKYSGYRYINAVEGMCPMMNRTALLKNLPYFCETKSGWGSDLVWGHLIRQEYGPASVAVIDMVRVKHLNPVGGGELYRKLKVAPKYELLETITKHRVKEHRIRMLDIPENRLWRLVWRRLRLQG